MVAVTEVLKEVRELVVVLLAFFVAAVVVVLPLVVAMPTGDCKIRRNNFKMSVINKATILVKVLRITQLPVYKLSLLRLPMPPPQPFLKDQTFHRKV